MKHLIAIFLGILGWNIAAAQATLPDTLLPAEAVQIGLERNYGVQLLRNEEQIASNNNTPGRAGMLPTVSTTGTASYSLTTTEQRFFSGDTRGGSGVGNLNTRLSLDVNWTAFDGFRMYVERDRLGLLERQSREQTAAEMQTLAAGILAAYYSLVQLERSTENLRYAVALDRDLFNLVRNKKTIGTATGLEVLQSQTRLNSDSARLVLLESDIARARMDFNLLLNRPAETTFALDADLSTGMMPAREYLLEQARQRNPAMILAKLRQEQATLAIEGVKSSFWPTVTLQAAYNFSYSRSEIGFLLSNQTFGPFLGLTVRYTIYDGQNRRQDRSNAIIQADNARLQASDAWAIIESRINSRYADYQAFRQLGQVEEANLAASRQQSELARELYRLGRTTNFEVREAILQEIQALDRVIDVQSRLKQAEIDLLNLAGIPLYSTN
ncbi:MAG: TolC family protein [Lewinellaceae bacterium]|nr:TolC family protein [Lewinellaceae bacterium]